MRKLVCALALAAVAVSSVPSYARPLDRPFYGADGRIHITAARATALRECNAIASQWPEYLWGNMGSYQYRACMNAHGQVE